MPELDGRQAELDDVDAAIRRPGGVALATQRGDEARFLNVCAAVVARTLETRADYQEQTLDLRGLSMCRNRA